MMPRIGLGAAMVHCSWIFVCALYVLLSCIVGRIEELGMCLVRYVLTALVLV